MRATTRALTGVATLILALAAMASHAPTPGTAAETKTAKERLTNKAADEQRVDNCRVPLERRGTTPRPDCPEARSSAPSENNASRAAPAR